MYCHKCGRKIPDVSQYCPYCGSRTSPEQKHMHSGNGNPPKRSFKFLIVICALLVSVIALGAAGMYVLRGSKVNDFDETLIQERTTTYENGDYLYQHPADALTIGDDGITLYYDDTLTVFLLEELEEDELTELAGLVNGKVVGRVSGAVNIVQIMVKPYTISKYYTLRETLLKSPAVLSVRYPTPMILEDSAEETGLFRKDHSSGNWWINAIGAELAWSFTGFAKDYSVGIIDSGFDTDHTAFQHNHRSKIQVLNLNTPSDHGTHVAGLIAATDDNSSGIRGIADRANLICVDWQLSEEHSFSDEEFIRWVNILIHMGVRVLNNSWAMTVSSDKNYQKTDLTKAIARANNQSASDITYEQYMETVRLLHKNSSYMCMDIIVTLLHDNIDFLIVQSSGNGYDNAGPGYSIDTDGAAFYGITEALFLQWQEDNTSTHTSASSEIMLYQSKLSYQDVKAHLIIVGAAENNTDDANRYKATPYSNYGNNVDIIAPGDGILSCFMNNKTEIDNGTSMASPLVAGTAAYVWALDPALTGREVKERLLSTASRAVGVTDDDKDREYPMLNAGSAVLSVVLGNISCTIVDDTGAPLPGVSCKRECSESDFSLLTQDMISEPNGSVFAPAVGHMTLTLEKEGYESKVIECDVNPRELMELGNIVLNKVKTYGGIYTVDAEMTNRHNADNLHVTFGSSIQYGYEMALNEDGTASWYIAAGWGGSGTYRFNGESGQLDYQGEEDSGSVSLQIVNESGTDYIVMDLDGYQLYWTKADESVPMLENTGETTEFPSGVTSGPYGNLYWAYDGAGTLTFSGDGPLDEASSDVEYIDGFPMCVPPWSEYTSEIENVVLEEGITAIYDLYTGLGDGSVPWGMTMDYATSITIPKSVSYIEDEALEGFGSLELIRGYANSAAFDYADEHGYTFYFIETGNYLDTNHEIDTSRYNLG